VQLCRAISLQLRHISTIGKNLLSSNISSTCLHNMVNFGPLAAEIGPVVWGTPPNFNGFRDLTSLLQRRRSTEANQTMHLCTMLGRLLGCYTMYTFSGALARLRNFTRCKMHAIRLAFSYIGSVTARHSSSGYQPNVAVWYNEWNYGTFAEGVTYTRLGGHHVGYWPTFEFYLFSSPNLSGRRLDVYRTSTHDVSLVQI